MGNSSDSTPPAVGQWLRLDAGLRSSGLWLGPVWAVASGIIASGQFSWNARSLLLAALTFFLVDGIWATLWTCIVETDWAAIVARWNVNPPPLRASAAARWRANAAGWLAHFSHWWTTELWPVAGSAVINSLVLLALGAAIAAVLGWQTLALSAAALAIIQTALVINRASGRPVSLLKAALEVGLGWLAGHVAFGSATLLSALMAAAFALAYAGGLELAGQRDGLARWRWPQVAAALILAIMRQPLAACMLLLAVFAQLLIEPALKQGRSGAWFVRSSQAWLIAAMLIAAFTIK